MTTCNIAYTTDISCWNILYKYTKNLTTSISQMEYWKLNLFLF